MGGTRLFGGEGNIFNAVVGVIIYQMIVNIMNIVSLDPIYQDRAGCAGAPHYSGISVSNVRLVSAGVAGFLFLSRAGYISYASASDLLMSTLAALVVGA